MAEQGDDGEPVGQATHHGGLDHGLGVAHPGGVAAPSWRATNRAVTATRSPVAPAARASWARRAVVLAGSGGRCSTSTVAMPGLYPIRRCRLHHASHAGAARGAPVPAAQARGPEQRPLDRRAGPRGHRRSTAPARSGCGPRWRPAGAHGPTATTSATAPSTSSASATSRSRTASPSSDGSDRRRHVGAHRQPPRRPGCRRRPRPGPRRPQPGRRLGDHEGRAAGGMPPGSRATRAPGRHRLGGRQRGDRRPGRAPRRRYRASHQGIGLPDYLIAATAEHLGATLWTRNPATSRCSRTCGPPY